MIINHSSLSQEQKRDFRCRLAFSGYRLTRFWHKIFENILKHGSIFNLYSAYYLVITQLLN